MSRTPTRWRENFIASMAREGVSVGTARAILSVTATLNRLAEAQCNGDWPCDNGERKTAPCPRCTLGYVPSTIKAKGCPECRAQDRARALVPEGWSVELSGDPRGHVVTLKTPQGREIGVP